MHANEAGKMASERDLREGLIRKTKTKEREGGGRGRIRHDKECEIVQVLDKFGGSMPVVLSYAN